MGTRVTMQLNSDQSRGLKYGQKRCFVMFGFFRNYGHAPVQMCCVSTLIINAARCPPRWRADSNVWRGGPNKHILRAWWKTCVVSGV